MMEADWEIEVGGGAPVIEALWAGFVDLRRNPERIAEVAEAVAFPPLAKLLAALNGDESPLWTAKCDVWEVEAEKRDSPMQEIPVEADPLDAVSEEACMACYIDLLPLKGTVFARWEEAEEFCRQWVSRLEDGDQPDCRIDLIVRQAIAGSAEGFGVTAYLSAMGEYRAKASNALAAALSAFRAAIP
jgi:hypothetical protein